MKTTHFAVVLLAPLAAFASGGTIERVEAGKGAVSVWVYDYAHIDAETLSQAKERASKIFRRARIDLDWVDCPLGADRQASYPGCKPGLHPVRLVVRIRAGIPPDERTRARSAFGFAYVPESGGSGFLADVYVSGADRMASGDTMQQGNMLGHLIAHELGHLLLGTTEHAVAGIMRSPFTGREIEQAKRGWLRFNTEESARLVANVMARNASR